MATSACHEYSERQYSDAPLEPEPVAVVASLGPTATVAAVSQWAGLGPKPKSQAPRPPTAPTIGKRDPNTFPAPVASLDSAAAAVAAATPTIVGSTGAIETTMPAIASTAAAAEVPGAVAAPPVTKTPSSATEPAVTAPTDASPTTQPSPPTSPVQTTPTPDKPSWDAEKEARLRSRAVAEIIDSEQRYVDDLRRFINIYIEPLRDEHLFPVFNRRDVQVVFSTIELIYQGNSELLAEIRSKMAIIPDTAIGTTFLSIGDRLQYYSVFCNHQEEARAVIEKIVQTSAPVRAFIDQAREQQGLGFLDFFVKPFQRLLKYPLLLRELLKHTPAGHPDYENLKQASASLQQVVDRINYVRAHEENMRKLVVVSESVVGLQNFADPKRLLILEGDVCKLKTLRYPSRHLVLFNDFLLICKSITLSSKYDLVHMLPVLNLHAAQADASSDLFREQAGHIRKPRPDTIFLLQDLDHHRQWYFITKTPQECTTWVKAIEAQSQLALVGSRSAPSAQSGSSQSSLHQQQQQEDETMGPSGGKIRVYYSRDCFKTLYIVKHMTAGEFLAKYSEKIAKAVATTFATAADSAQHRKHVEGAETLILHIGTSERALDASELPWEIQTNLISSGTRFGTPEAHFRISTGNFSAAASILTAAVTAAPAVPISTAIAPQTWSPGSSPGILGDSQSPPASPLVLPQPSLQRSVSRRFGDSLMGSQRSQRPESHSTPILPSSLANQQPLSQQQQQQQHQQQQQQQMATATL